MPNPYGKKYPFHKFAFAAFVVTFELFMRIAQAIFGRKRVNMWMAVQIKKYVIKPTPTTK